MDSRPLYAAVALLAVLALVVGAPTLDRPVESGDGSVVSGERRGFDSADAETPSALRDVSLLVFLLVGVAALAYGLRQYRSSDYVTMGLTAVVLTVVFVVVGWNPSAAGGFAGPVVENATAGAVAATRPGSRSAWLVGAVGSFALVVLAGIVLFRAADAETWTVTDADTETEDGTATEDPTALGEAAGRAADRIADDAPLDNAVYRAWREMTDALAVPDPETSTPGEFQTAAVDAGMDPEDVAVLTDLFRTVRYGDRPATEERERRAEQALRNVERAYGGAS
ncbi:DUF4129 domain-containing protein [Haloarcula nitratireducens]|uniref:DUF4129 domain-containing protein n=1 Tax=Haloarcula nitratireducens TaxID=2487749 RepID=A0AAW4P6A5_9EURY|nr:DUF4129 domain-containing protein [Halomicroarcula nitratireducens]MBX0293288.1 DUF4129 domain-containing protein [Halomicroarcula nitratireducens]